MPTVMKAAQALSQAITLETLLITLKKLTMEHAGAQAGTLVLKQDMPEQDDPWVVVSITNPEQPALIEIPLKEYSQVPQTFVYAVIRGKEAILSENLSAESEFAGDRYIINHKPKSALAMPITRQGKLIGVLYLENNLASGAFTHAHLEILQLITAQAAISIENTRLYEKTKAYSHQLEAEVSLKTQALNQKAQDLETALTTLQHTQAQLIQTEKMSSLNQLVAGIAHEINNPVNFIKGNIQHTQRYFEDIVDLLEMYQEAYPNPTEDIQAKEEELDITFLVEDTTKMLSSMTLGSDRIREIVRSLRSFSRLDEASIKAVDIHEGLESSLMLLKNQLDVNGVRRQIQVTRNYSTLPQITCNPSQINQVFLEIIKNAIDSLKADTAHQPEPEIRICTSCLTNGDLKITISNNGEPIPEELQARIFDPFFTTKSIGSGTGLGLFVSYTTLEKHGGSLTVSSSPKTETTFEIILPYISKE